MSILELIKYNLFPPKRPDEIAKRLTEKIAGESFKLFREPQFHELVNYEKLQKEEQDRIFNEIVLTGLALAILMFGYLEEYTKNERAKQFYAELQMEMESYYSNWLKELGTPTEFTELWKKLIKMRTDEYRRDYKEHQKELEKDWKKNPWVFVATIGGYHHIRRGKGKPEDPLFKFFLKWVIKIANDISATTLKMAG